MKNWNKILDFLKTWEGIRLKAYKCQAGIYSIGIGNTYYPDGTRVKKNDIITIERAYEICKWTIEKDIIAKCKLLQENSLNENQETAIISLIYNIGIGAFLGSTLLRVLHSTFDKDYNNIRSNITQSWLMWNKITIDGKKVVNEGLSKRRQAEVDLFFKEI